MVIIASIVFSRPVIAFSTLVLFMMICQMRMVVMIILDFVILSCIARGCNMYIVCETFDGRDRSFSPLYEYDEAVEYAARRRKLLNTRWRVDIFACNLRHVANVINPSMLKITTQGNWCACG